MRAIVLTDGKREIVAPYRDVGETEPGVYTTVFAVEGRTIYSRYADPLRERSAKKRLRRDRLVLLAEGLDFAVPFRVIDNDGEVLTV